MRRPWFLTIPAAVSLGLCLATTQAQAQLDEVGDKRYEITPYAGYQWGGSFDTQGGGGVPAGTLSVNSSFAWGAVISFLARLGTALELTYLRQDTDLEFKQAVGGTTDLGGFATNYIQLGGRQEFGSGINLHPFVTASLGLAVLDPKEGNIDATTRFSWSVGGGAKYMLANGRTGIRTDVKLWVTPVPSGTYGGWCDVFGCFVAQGTAWVTQGQVTGGLVFAF
jgi:opacity protein-like surface antigen